MCPRYFVAAIAAGGSVTLQPVVIGALLPQPHPAWTGGVWRMTSAAALTPGTMLFTHEGELVGAVDRDDGRPIVIPGDVLLTDAQRLLTRDQQSHVDLGLEVQALTAPLRAATGSNGGAIVSWVRTPGPTAPHLLVGDVIEAVNGVAIESPQDWLVRVSRLRAGENVTLSVMRLGTRSSISFKAPEPPPARSARAGRQTARHPRSGLGGSGHRATFGRRRGRARRRRPHSERRPRSGAGPRADRAGVRRCGCGAAHHRRRGPWRPTPRRRAGEVMLSILDRTDDEGDPIDVQLSRLGAAPTRGVRRRPWYSRFALGWASGTSPLLMLFIGAALGPHGLSLLSPGILSAIDPAVPVALAALGVHLALHVDLTPIPSRLRRAAGRRRRRGAGGRHRRHRLAAADDD